MITPEQIVSLYRSRKAEMEPVNAKRIQVRDAYNGDLAVSLPDMGRQVQASVANLLNSGLDQLAMRVSSTLPAIHCPPRDESVKREVTNALKRQRALYGWWEANDLDGMLPIRARQMLAYASSPVMLWPDFKRGIPAWRMRDPFGTFPSACMNPGDMTPQDCVFAYRQTYGWLLRQYPDQMERLYRKEKPERDARLVLLDYVDDKELVTVVLSEAGADDRNPYGVVSGVGTGFLGSAPQVELERIPNRAGICTVVVPGRITLDKALGQFDQMIGLYQTQAHLTALELIAVEKGIFPDTYLESRPGEQAKFVTGPHDGRTGLVNIVQGGTVREVGTNPGFQTNPTIDRLERASRLAGGIPAEFGGECVDEETEILTTSGWRDYQDVDPGDLVLTLNHETGMSEWQPVQKMNVFPADRRMMVEMEGPRHSSLTTRNHRWAVVRRGERLWKHSTEFTSNDQIPIAAMNADLPTEAKFSDAMVEAVAWLYTEGHIRGNRAEISQSLSHNPDHVERIRACLTTLFGQPVPVWRDVNGSGQGGVGHDGVPRWNESPPAQNNVIKFNLSKHAAEQIAQHCPDKVPSHSFLLSLTAAQLELFLLVSMYADNCGPDRFGQKDAARAEAFAFATILAGRAVSYQTRVRQDDRPDWPSETTAYIVRSRKRRVVKPKESALRGASTYREVPHAGIVWCPTTPNGTWFARRRGSVYFTGNSASNVRTGKRGDAILSAAVDYPVAEQQKVLARSMREENKRAIAIMKGYFGTQPQSYYVSWKGAKGHVDFVAKDIFTTDHNVVAYSHVGSDLNGLTILIGQLVGMGLLSKQTASELTPLIDNPEQEHDRSVSEALEQALLSAVQQKANSGEMNPIDVAWITEQVKSNKLELAEALIKVDERVQKRQAETQQQMADPNQPDPMAGLAAGTPAEAQAIGPAIPEGPESQRNLTGILGALRMGQMQTPAERPAVA